MVKWFNNFLPSECRKFSPIYRRMKGLKRQITKLMPKHQFITAEIENWKQLILNMYLTVYKALYNYKLTFWWNILKIYFPKISCWYFPERISRWPWLLYNKTIYNFMFDKILMISKLINNMFPIRCIQNKQIRIFSNSDTSGFIF